MKILKYSKWPYCQRNIQSNTFRGESGQQICDTIFQIRACFAKNTTSQHKVQLKAKILQYLFKYNRNFQLQMASKFTKRTRKTKQVITIASCSRQIFPLKFTVIQIKIKWFMCQYIFLFFIKIQLLSAMLAKNYLCHISKNITPKYNIYHLKIWRAYHILEPLPCKL